MRAARLSGGGRWAEWYAALAGTCGPAVAALVHRLVALNFLWAWASLGWQVRLLMGERGLMPVADLARFVAERDLSFFEVPTLLRWVNGDGVLVAGCLVGMGLSVAAFAGMAPRILAAANVLLYMSYAVGGRTFLSFQWDNLLLEAGALMVALPRDHRSRWSHLLLRVLLFKLYFESGVAKWLSHLGDWHDGSAMTFYYETAPLPGLLAWHFHNLPEAWHRLESWAVLGLELVVPFLFFGPRRWRLVSAALLSAFQLVNLATASYGFFITLTLALHVVLLDDGDLDRARRWLEGALKADGPGPVRAAGAALGRAAAWLLGSRPPDEVIIARPRLRTAVAVTVSTLYVGLSGLEGATRFGPLDPTFASSLRTWAQPLRIVNTYHLFGHITRERIEPELQVQSDGAWLVRELWHKPGDVRRTPGWVVPHQPRVDFQLWFHGLSYRRLPPWVAALLRNACDHPEVVDPLLRAPVPPRREAVRMAYWRYTFTTPAEREATGALWNRQLVHLSPPTRCRSAPAPP